MPINPPLYQWYIVPSGYPAFDAPYSLMREVVAGRSVEIPLGPIPAYRGDYRIDMSKEAERSIKAKRNARS